MAIANEIKNTEGEVIDYQRISKTILLSQPPCAADIESQIKFCKTWGGGKLQEVTFDICNYIKLCEVNHKVSSAHFDACTSLKCPPQNLPTRLIAAVIKTVATRGTSNNGLGVCVASAQIKQIMKDDDVMKQARDLTDRAYRMCSNIKGIDADTLAKQRGDFECNIVEKAFNVKNLGKVAKDKTMEQMIEEFVKNINGFKDEVVGGQGDRDEAQGAIFDSTAHDAHIKALEKVGVRKGGLLMSKKSKDDAKNVLETMYEVMYINDDGSFGLRRVLHDGKLDEPIKVVPMDDINLYSSLKQEQRLSASKLGLPTIPNDDILATIAD